MVTTLCYCSIAKSCLTLCDPVDCNIPVFLSCTISGSLLKLRSSESVLLSNHLIHLAPCSSCPQSFSASGSFPVSWLFASGGQSTVASASASVLPVNIQSWFPFRLSGLIFLLSKGLSRVFSSTTVRRHQFFGSLFYCPTLTSIHDYGKNHSFSVVFFLLEKPSRQPQICLRICLLWTSHMSEIIWMGCGFLYLSSFTSSIHVVPYINTLFFLLLNNTPMYAYDRFIYPFIILWTCGLFSPFVITNNADMNVCVNICFQLSWIYT